MDSKIEITMLVDEELAAVSGGKGKKKGWMKRVEQTATVTQDLSEVLDLSGVSGSVTINGGIRFGDDSATATVTQSA